MSFLQKESGWRLKKLATSFRIFFLTFFYNASKGGRYIARILLCLAYMIEKPFNKATAKIIRTTLPCVVWC